VGSARGGAGAVSSHHRLRWPKAGGARRAARCAAPWAPISQTARLPAQMQEIIVALPVEGSSDEANAGGYGAGTCGQARPQRWVKWVRQAGGKASLRALLARKPGSVPQR